VAGGDGVSALDEHPVWSRLTDAQRADANRVWEEIVTPALQDAEDTHRDAVRVLIAAQDHRDAVSAFVRDATFAAARMPGHEPAYGCCTHGPDAGRVCGCRTRGAA
jgi:hypothetical protein